MPRACCPPAALPQALDNRVVFCRRVRFNRMLLVEVFPGDVRYVRRGGEVNLCLRTLFWRKANKGTENAHDCAYNWPVVLSKACRHKPRMQGIYGDTRSL